MLHPDKKMKDILLEMQKEFMSHKYSKHGSMCSEMISYKKLEGMKNKFKNLWRVSSSQTISKSIFQRIPQDVTPEQSSQKTQKTKYSN